MIVTPQFVFIHIHKTGGQFLNKAILDYIPGAQRIGYHYPLNKLPEKYAHLPVIAFARNPWDWYVSWYMFNKSRPDMNPIYRVLSNENTSGFNETVKRMIALGNGALESSVLISRLSNVLPNFIEGNRSSGITKKCIGTLRECGMGYYSWLLHRMLKGNNSAHTILVGKYEQVRSTFLESLTKVGAPVSAEIKHYLINGEPVNASIRQSYREYYDAELKLLIQENDSGLIGKYEYRY